MKKSARLSVSNIGDPSMLRPPLRRWRPACLVTALLACFTLSCNATGFGGLLGFFGNQVTIEIRNETSFTAIPDLRTGDSRNFVEDIFDDGEPLTGFGVNGTVAANQTVTLVLGCDDDLEMIAIGGAAFRDNSGFPLGDADGDELLRRDVDFDCGDVIVIQLSGSIFSFRSDVTVERSTRNDDLDSDGNNGDDSLGDDIADFLDDLFGS